MFSAEILHQCEAGTWQDYQGAGLLSCESCQDTWKEVSCSPVQLLAGLQVIMGPGDSPAEAEDSPPGLKQRYPPTSFLV